MQLSGIVSKAATKCDKDFACLSGSVGCMCWVTYASRYRFVEIKPRSDEHCPYLFHYCEGTYCLCPTRNEVYNRYKI